MNHLRGNYERVGEWERGREGDKARDFPVAPSPFLPLSPSLSRFRRGFSAVELLVVIGILLVLISIFVPYLLKIRESDHRVACANNLNQIRTVLNQYAMMNAGNYPRVVYDVERNPNGYTCFTGADGGDPFAPQSAVQANDVTASLWLLARMKLIEPRAFMCPSTNDIADSLDNSRRGNFRGPANLSYSYASPFSAAPSYRLNDTRRSEFAVMADKNPGVDEGRSNAAGPAMDAPPLSLAVANSNNHRKAGQNVLYADGHINFQATPYCGMDRDNIYTALASQPLLKDQTLAKNGTGVTGRGVGPAWEFDSYLVPTATDGMEAPSAPATTAPATTVPATHPPTFPTTMPEPSATTPTVPTVPAPATQPPPTTTTPVTLPATAP